jgi:hypothetical protein
MARLRVALCNLQIGQEKAIENQDFLKAETLKEEIKEKRLELELLEQDLKQEQEPPEEVEMV